MKKLKYKNDTILTSFIKRIAFKYSKNSAPNYPYLIEPIQLANIVHSIDSLLDIKGSIIEIGVARGMTSYLIAHHLNLIESLVGRFDFRI